MPLRRHIEEQLTLVGAGRIFVVLAVVYAVAVVGLSVGFLRHVETGAASIQEQRIPAILTQNRNAVKVERLGSLVRSVYLARDARIERQVQLQVSALTQSFSLDRNERLSAGGRRIAEEVKRIVELRTLARSSPGDAAEEEIIVRRAYEDAMKAVEGLSQYLAGDAALAADDVSRDIRDAASRIRGIWIAILAVPALGALLLFWLFQRHVVRPINGTIDRLATIGAENRDGPPMAEPVLGELRMITRAVEAYGELSAELRRTNEALQVLSGQDALTHVGNRRSFDAALDLAFAEGARADGRVSLLLLDLDNFKHINDVHGHQVGDVCLRTVASAIDGHCRGTGYKVARYGGEEFAVILPGADLAAAVLFAERLRVAVSALPVADVTARDGLRLTTSVGVASLDAATGTPAALIAAADAALYEAKNAGRNIVRCRRTEPAAPARAKSRSAG
jgi:diguanylate cyclase (GGDEF) domain